ncbi:hypothetical protein DRQ09_09485, partial [candidate division KSB1 bacterium]
NNINDLLIDGDYLWVGTDYGLFKIDLSNMNYTRYSSSNDLEFDSITKIAKDSSGNIWVISDGNGVNMFNGTNWTIYSNNLSSLDVTDIKVDQSGIVWISTSYELNSFNGNTWSSVVIPGSGGTNISTFIEIAPDTSVWFGLNNSGIVHYYIDTNQDTFWVTYDVDSGLVDYTTTTGLFDSQGNLWIGTVSGISKFDLYNTWVSFTNDTGYLNSASDIYEDFQGNIWICTNRLNKYDGTKWERTYLLAGPDTVNFNSIVEDYSGNFWIGTDKGLFKYDGSEYTHLLLGPFGNSVNDIAFKSNGTAWINSSSYLCRFGGRYFRLIYTTNSDTLDNVSKVFIDSENNLWVGTTGNGLWKFNSLVWLHYTTADGLLNNSILALFEDSQGNIWIGTEGGVNKYDGSSFTGYTNANTSGGLVADYVQAINQDILGNMWFGTSSEGLSKFDGTNWESFTSPSCIPSNNVQDIIVDCNGNLWVATDNGAALFDRNNWFQFDDYNYFNDLFIHSMDTDPNCVIWFATEGGITSNQLGYWDIMTSYDYSEMLSDLIYVVKVDKHNMVWMGSDNGLNIYAWSIPVPVLLPDTTIALNQQFTIPSSILIPINYITSFELTLEYNDSILNFLGYNFDNSNITNLSSFLIEDNILPGEVRIAGASNQSTWLTGLGRFIDFKFEVKPEASVGDVSNLKFTKLIFDDGITPVKGINGKVTIIVLFGDISGDETISALDASYILQSVVGLLTLTSEQESKADVSYNGVISSYDAALILQYVAGYISTFPVESALFSKPTRMKNVKIVVKPEENENYITYNLYTKNLKDVVAGEFSIKFDPAELEFESYKVTPGVKNLIVEKNIIKNSLNLAFASANPIQGNKLISIKFRKKEGFKSGTISFEKFMLNDSHINKIDFTSRTIPEKFDLFQNYPNPFNSETVIKFQLPEPGRVSLIIYNLLGQKIRTLVDSYKNSGYYSIKWDGKNDTGERVSSGIYFYKIQT